MEDLIFRYINSLKKLDSIEYAFDTVITAIAPTICGIKCGSLVNITNKNKCMRDIWVNKGKQFLEQINLNYFTMDENEDRFLIYFYNDKVVNNILSMSNITTFLENFGYYNINNVSEVLYLIKKRFSKGIPHEIGLLLGIPLEDVKGYIRYKGENYLYCGYWKVYANLDDSLKVFNNYNILRKEVMDCIAKEYNWIKIIEYLKER